MQIKSAKSIVLIKSSCQECFSKVIINNAFSKMISRYRLQLLRDNLTAWEQGEINGAKVDEKILSLERESEKKERRKREKVFSRFHFDDVKTGS